MKKTNLKRIILVKLQEKLTQYTFPNIPTFLIIPTEFLLSSVGEGDTHYRV